MRFSFTLNVNRKILINLIIDISCKISKSVHIHSDFVLMSHSFRLFLHTILASILFSSCKEQIFKNFVMYKFLKINLCTTITYYNEFTDNNV